MEHSHLGDPFLTVADVAQLLKLNQQTVRNWIDQGSLPAHRVGRRVRIKRSDLEQLLAEGYTAASRSTAEDRAAPEDRATSEDRGTPEKRSTDERSTPQQAGPSADDFWSGDPVALGEPLMPDDLDPSPVAEAERTGG